MSPAWPLSAIARSIVGDVPVCSTSRMIARRGGTDVRDLPQRAVGLKQRLDRLFERQDGAAARL